MFRPRSCLIMKSFRWFIHLLIVVYTIDFQIYTCLNTKLSKPHVTCSFHWKSIGFDVICSQLKPWKTRTFSSAVGKLAPQTPFQWSSQTLHERCQTSKTPLFYSIHELIKTSWAKLSPYSYERQSWMWVVLVMQFWYSINFMVEYGVWLCNDWFGGMWMLLWFA